MDNTKSSEIDDFIAKYSPFLAEIRKRIIIIAVVFVTASVVGFVFYEKLVALLIFTLSLKGVNVVFTSPFQFINLAINCGIAVGLVSVFPLIIFQVFSFLKPALRRNEFKMLLGFLPFSIVLFLTGFAFGIYIMRWQIQLSLAKSIELGIGNILDINNLIGIVILVSSIMGLAFQFPIVLMLLMKLGLIDRKQLAGQRTWVYFGALLFIIVLPIDSLLADALLALPLIGLFELSLIFDKVFKFKKS